MGVRVNVRVSKIMRSPIKVGVRRKQIVEPWIFLLNPLWPVNLCFACDESIILHCLPY